jgi:hypothetical protein
VTIGFSQENSTAPTPEQYRAGIAKSIADLNIKPTPVWKISNIFKEGEAVDKAISYSKMKWTDISKIPQNSMKPLTENAKLKILSVSKRELKSGKTNGLPKDYLTIADYLKDGTSLYAMLYLNEDGTEQKMRSAFFKASEKWIIIPLAYKAFE